MFNSDPSAAGRSSCLPVKGGGIACAQRTIAAITYVNFIRRRSHPIPNKFRRAPNEGKDHLRVRTHERNRHVGHQIAHNEARTRRRQALHAAQIPGARGRPESRRKQMELKELRRALYFYSEVMTGTAPEWSWVKLADLGPNLVPTWVSNFGQVGHESLAKSLWLAIQTNLWACQSGQSVVPIKQNQTRTGGTYVRIPALIMGAHYGTPRSPPQRSSALGDYREV
ncbi:hypothetical protein BJ912DRAFT_930833 [Pholiota molesta]|nr:hypothetical protein BJ912DRAFT_930833 [Pholiota molesta]